MESTFKFEIEKFRSFTSIHIFKTETSKFKTKFKYFFLFSNFFGLVFGKQNNFKKILIIKW